MVSVALLICASFATQAEAMGLMHTNTNVEMAVASSGEMHVVADDEMELMSNKHLVLQNNYIDQMETSVQFKNEEGGRCLSSNVDKYSRLTFEDCDVSSTEQLWTKLGDTYVSAAKLQLQPAEHLCPHKGPYVNCGQNSTVLGECPAGHGFKVWETHAGNLLQTHEDAEGNQHCLAIFMKMQKDDDGVKKLLVDKGYENLVVVTRGTTHFCGTKGSTWQVMPVASTPTAIADAAAAAAATAVAAAAAAAKAAAEAATEAAAKAAAEAAAEAAGGVTLFKLMTAGTRCSAGTAITYETECRAAMKELKISPPLNLVDSREDKAPGCYQNKKGSKVFFNSHPTGQNDASVPSICHVAAAE